MNTVNPTGRSNDGRLEGGSTLLPLELERVCFERNGQALLTNVNLQLSVGGRTMILGPNGAGKSLLMRLCHGLIEPSAGRVRWMGAEGRDSGAVRRRQAMVFQKPVLLRRSVMANVVYALRVRGVNRRDAHQQAMHALERFGLAPIASRAARVLSGGEQQRLVLARAWALQPEVLFLDEPSASLDPAATRTVEAAVQAFYAAGTRIIMSTHDLGQARRLADDVVFVCGGRVVEHAPADRFFSAPQSGEASAFIRGELVW